jgi:DNA-binding transcriptional LysR family regulator
VELAQLQLVKHILMTGSLSKAAARLNRAQSVVSRQLATLEKECGGRLFYRNGRGVMLTELGERILPQIDLILAAAHDIAGSGETLKNDIGGDVRLHVSPIIAHGLMGVLFKNLRERYPSIRLRVSEGFSSEIERDLEEGNTDLAVYLRGGTTVGWRDHPICEPESYLIGPPSADFKGGESIRFANIAGLPLLLPSSPGPCRSMLNEVASARGVTLNIVAEATGPGATRLMLMAGAGYVITPLCMTPGVALSWVEDEIARGALCATRIVDPTLSRTLVVRTAATTRRRVEVVARQIVTTLRALIGAPPMPSETTIPLETRRAPARK